MLALTLSVLPFLSAIPLLSTSAAAQDVGQVGDTFVDFDVILDPSWSADQLNWHNQMCNELGQTAEGLQGNHGVDTWTRLRLDSVLVEYLDNNPPVDDWTGRLYRDHLAIEPVANFRCQTDQDQCVINPGCDAYRHKTGPWISIAIGNLQQITKAHIAAYDRVLELLGENNQALAKSLFQTSLGRDRTKFDVQAFFQGFLDGVELLLGPTKVLSAFKGAIKFLAKEQLEQRLPSLSVGPAPEEDATTFLTSLRDTFRTLQDAERRILGSFMDSGVVNNNASPAHSEIVAFLQSGQLLNLPSFSSAGLVNDFAQEILKQTAAKIVAGTWASQNAGISIRDTRFCDNDVCSFSNCGPPEWRQKTDITENALFGFQSTQCLDIGRGFDIPAGLPGTLLRLGLGLAAIHRNAAMCAILGQPGLNTDINDFGFARCTFNLPRRDTIG